MEQITYTIKFIAILFAIDAFWKILEILFYGSIQPRKIDAIIAILWALTILYKLK